MKHNNLNFKWITLVILCLLCFQEVGAVAIAIDGIHYNITEYSDGSAVASVVNNGSFNSYSGFVVIPDEIYYDGVAVPVTGIGYQAFKGCTGLTGVVIPEGVTMLLNESFAGCTSLISITLPSTMRTIYNYAFVGCTNLVEIYCMRSTAVTFNANNFDTSTYSNATLYVPHGSLESYSNTSAWSQFSNIVETDKFMVDGICYRDEGLNNVSVTFRGGNFGTYQGTVIVPPKVTYNNVTYNVYAVGNDAFRDCDYLFRLELPSSITAIGYRAFQGCDNMYYLVCRCQEPPYVNSDSFSSTFFANAYLFVPYGYEQTYLNADYWNRFGEAQTFGTYDFEEGGNYYHITSPTTVSECAYALGVNGTTVFPRPDRDVLKHAIIPATVTHDGVTYGVTDIGMAAFAWSDSLETVMLPEGIQTISDLAFYSDEQLTDIHFPNTLVSIGVQAFIYCESLHDIIIPNSVKTIGHSAFYFCFGLKNITLGSGLEWIGSEAFDMLTSNSLESVTCHALVPPDTPEPDPQSYDVGMFAVVSYNNATLYVPSSSLSAYQTALEWKNFKSIVPFVTLDEALNVEGGTIHFESSGDYPWQVVSEDGIDYAMSGNGGVHSSSSVLTATVTLSQESRLSFNYMSRGEGSANIYDACSFLVDGVEQFRDGALGNEWRTFTLNLSPGTHALEWRYTKDVSVHPNGDYFAVDNVAIMSATVRGDVDGNTRVDMDDLTALINYLLTGDDSLINYAGANADNIDGVSMDDLTVLINYLLTNQWPD